MTKLIVSRAVEFVGSQASVFLLGTLVTYACHVWFGLTPEQAAHNVVAAQVACAAWIVRGWM